MYSNILWFVSELPERDWEHFMFRNRKRFLGRSYWQPRAQYFTSLSSSSNTNHSNVSTNTTYTIDTYDWEIILIGNSITHEQTMATTGHVHSRFFFSGAQLSHGNLLKELSTLDTHVWDFEALSWIIIRLDKLFFEIYTNMYNFLDLLWKTNLHFRRWFLRLLCLRGN